MPRKFFVINDEIKRIAPKMNKSINSLMDLLFYTTAYYMTKKDLLEEDEDIINPIETKIENGKEVKVRSNEEIFDYCKTFSEILNKSIKEMTELNNTEFINDFKNTFPNNNIDFSKKLNSKDFELTPELIYDNFENVADICEFLRVYTLNKNIGQIDKEIKNNVQSYIDIYESKYEKIISAKMNVNINKRDILQQREEAKKIILRNPEYNRDSNYQMYKKDIIDNDPNYQKLPKEEKDIIDKMLEFEGKALSESSFYDLVESNKDYFTNKGNEKAVESFLKSGIDLNKSSEIQTEFTELENYSFFNDKNNFEDVENDELPTYRPELHNFKLNDKLSLDETYEQINDRINLIKNRKNVVDLYIIPDEKNVDKEDYGYYKGSKLEYADLLSAYRELKTKADKRGIIDRIFSFRKVKKEKLLLNELKSTIINHPKYNSNEINLESIKSVKDYLKERAKDEIYQEFSNVFGKKMTAFKQERTKVFNYLYTNEYKTNENFKNFTDSKNVVTETKTIDKLEYAKARNAFIDDFKNTSLYNDRVLEFIKNDCDRINNLANYLDKKITEKVEEKTQEMKMRLDEIDKEYKLPNEKELFVIDNDVFETEVPPTKFEKENGETSIQIQNERGI